MLDVLLHLGYGFVRASVTLPFRVGRGEDRFLRSFAPEGLLPATEVQRDLSAAFERCIGCGFCELAMPGAAADIPRSFWRSPESWRGLVPILERLNEDDLSSAEALCPTEVPLRALVRMLGDVVKRWDELKEGS
jgi:ferredoxin